jgi:hypothetical protein
MKKSISRKTTVHEKTRARQTGTSIKKLRAEQKQAEKSVVPAKYRKAYKNDSCGDDVAVALKEAFGSGEDFDIAGLIRCLKDNACKVPNVDMKSHGAVGRFRMCAGLALRAALKRNGNLVIFGHDLKSAHVVDKKTKRVKGRRAKAA